MVLFLALPFQAKKTQQNRKKTMVALPERNNNNPIGDYLLASLLYGAKPSQNGNPQELQNWVAIIVPNGRIFVNQTIRRLTEIFEAASDMPASKWFLGKIWGTYTFDSGAMGTDTSWLVISWMNETSLENNWDQVRDFAATLQRNSGEECIGVIRNGVFISVRDWGR